MGKRWKLILASVILISVLLRLVTAHYFGDQVESFPGTADQVSYHTLALRVLNGHGFSFESAWWPATHPGAPTAHWSYLYTFYLVAVYSFFGAHPLVARVIQVILVGVLHPTLIFLISKRLYGFSVGFVAVVLTAFYTYFIYYSATLMTEPFYITLILVSLFLAIRLGDHVESVAPLSERLSLPAARTTGGKAYLTAGLLGASLAGAVLLRQLFLLFVPVLFLWIWWRWKWKNARFLLVSAAVIAVSILPFTIYNYARFDRFVLLNNNAGFAFFWGNHPIYGTRFIPVLPSEAYIQMIPQDLRLLDEAALDQALLRRGLMFVADDPLRYLQLSLSRIPALFMFWPSPESGLISNISRITSFGLLWPFMLYGMIRSLFFIKKPGENPCSNQVSLLYLFVAFYISIHLLSWALIRYRLPVDAVMIVFAGFAFVDIARLVVPAIQPVSSTA